MIALDYKSIIIHPHNEALFLLKYIFITWNHIGIQCASGGIRECAPKLYIIVVKSTDKSEHNIGKYGQRGWQRDNN